MNPEPEKEYGELCLCGYPREIPKPGEICTCNSTNCSKTGPTGNLCRNPYHSQDI